ncbi:MAG: SufE family protein [Bacteroidota bacterium]|nr:SufE family protein [Bacteroidota bacterium]
MSSIKQIQEDITAEFNSFDNWVEKYEYLIDLGKELPEMEEKYKVDENLIRGCQSKVWLFAKKNEDKIVYIADSDAIMTKGIIALLIRVFSKQNSTDIINTDLYFIKSIGLQDQLSQTRSNGLLSMIKQIKIYALAYDKK